MGIVPPLGLIGLKQLKLPANHLKFWWGGPSLAKIVLNATSEGFFNLDNLDSQTDAQYSQKRPQYGQGICSFATNILVLTLSIQ